MITLEEMKKTKDGEIEKYKKYLNKAKKIIESFGGNKGQSSDDNMEVNRNSEIIRSVLVVFCLSP